MTAVPKIEPDLGSIRADLEHMTRRWGELPRKAMFELRSFAKGTAPAWAQFTPSRIEEAVSWAATQNMAGRNVYAVRNPIDLNHRGPATDDAIMAAFFCWADCDDPAATDNVRKFEGPRWTASVVTGKIPTTRVHLYWMLEEPCYNLAAWRGLQEAIAGHFGSDPTVVNASRIMRVGGTISHPDPNKISRGYTVEACTFRAEYSDDRDPVEFERLLRVFGGSRKSRKKADSGATFDFDTGFEDKAKKFADYLKQCSIDGQKHYGVRGISAMLGARQIEPEIVAALIRHISPVWDDNIENLIKSGYRFAPEGDQDAVQPVDLWGTFPPPELPKGILPKQIEDLAFIQGKMMGADPGGLAAAALCVCCAAIPDRVRVKVKQYDDWTESARIWVALVGDPSTKKSPILSTAEKPLRKIDARLFRDYIARKADYDALKKEEKAETERPRQIRKRLEDTTIEAAQEVMADSPDGVLVVQDELSGWFGGMDRYANGKGKDRGFWLQAFNGGVYAVNRVGRGAGMISNLSACVLGGIQPEPIRKIVAEASDDGLIQRLFPIVLKPATLGCEDAPPTDAVKAYAEAVEALTRVEVMAGGPFAFAEEGGPKLSFSTGAAAIRRELEEKHLELMSVECVNRKLAAHIGKYDGLFARLCVAFHCLDYVSDGMVPDTISEGVAKRAAAFLHGFLLPHAIAFYGGVLDLSDDHDRLSAVAGYILAHGLQTVNARDVARGDSTMRKLTRADTMRIFEQLEALGWVAQQPAPARANAAPAWVVNPEVHRLFAERKGSEVSRRRKAQQAIREAAQWREKAADE